MPTTGLSTLEEPLALVAGDDTVKECLLGAGVIQIVVDDVVAESAPGDNARMRCPRVAEATRGLLDPVQAARAW
jgi:hypothetical protein